MDEEPRARIGAVPTEEPRARIGAVPVESEDFDGCEYADDIDTAINTTDVDENRRLIDNSRTHHVNDGRDEFGGFPDLGIEMSHELCQQVGFEQFLPNQINF